MARQASPYVDAPRLPEQDEIDVASLLAQTTGDLELEIGPGRGMFLLERLAAAPDARVIGLEIRRKWSQLVDEKVRARGLGARARVLADDARLALAKLRPDGAVARVFVHFPDPWWKKRHAKRFVIGDALVGEIARLLRPGGELFVQTDVEDRAAQYVAEIAKDLRLSPAGDAPGSPRLSANPYGARSNREKRADEDGLPVHRMRWTRA
ncbi:MAG: methyltransferase domain-containing protein [Polyangiaceae bacterium]|nr:methyltransferase domain-containing protein [Polyangiaceae bacterium]